VSDEIKDLKIIKERILKEDRIEELLDLMGCDKIDHEQGGKLVIANLPDKFKSNNSRSVQVRKNDSLTSFIRSRSVKGDIFSLVSFIVNGVPANETQSDLSKAKQWVIEVMNYHDIVDGRYSHKTKKNNNSWLKEIKKKRNKINWDDIKPNNPIDEEIKNQYVMTPWYDWIVEGISWETQMEFEVGYDLWTDRVVTMVRNRDGKLIGVKGRYVGDNEEILDRKKYLYLHRMNKSVELFNLHRALPYILKHKKVIVWEGYKSVMKCHDIGIYNTVSMEGDDLSPVQVSILKELGIDIEIILALDKDKMLYDGLDKDGKEIFLEEPKELPIAIMEQAEKFTNRSAYAIIDYWNVLDKKDSPIDKGKDIFVQLYKRKKKLPIVNVFQK
jgi:DNA primase